MTSTPRAGQESLLSARPRYAPSTTKAEWIAYSELLEAALGERDALLDIALAAANFRDSFSLPIGESYVAVESLDAAFARLEEIRRG